MTKDIGDVVTTVLRDGPSKQKDYYLSIDVLTSSKQLKFFLNFMEIKCDFVELDVRKKRKLI